MAKGSGLLRTFLHAKNNVSAEKVVQKVASNADATKTDIFSSALNKLKNSENKTVQALLPKNGNTKVYQEASNEVINFADQYVANNPTAPNFGKSPKSKQLIEQDRIMREVNASGRRYNDYFDDVFEYDLDTDSLVPSTVSTSSAKPGYTRYKTNAENVRDYFTDETHGRLRKGVVGAGIGATALVGAGIDASDGEGGFGGAIMGASMGARGAYGLISAAARRM